MKWIFCALFLTVSATAKAQAILYGLGQDSCSEFVAAAGLARTGDPSLVTGYLHWIAGYASSLSLLSDRNVLGGKSSADIQYELERYCRENPDDSFIMAAASIGGDSSD
jgi:hypothetical protein|tara:strand:+ start:24401 stop:24727 length:327 start_codon:yes stop_codon:yes gene_type:complete